MEEKSPVYLVMVTQNNNNKYYRMIPQGDRFEVEFGRVGASCQHASYPISQWNKKYNEKIRKGYVDQTHLVQDLIKKEQPKEKTEYRAIENESVAEIVQRLQDMARQKVSANYRVSSSQVTQAMVDEAQRVIDDLTSITSIGDFNDTLLKLYTVIPRKMVDVRGHLAKSADDFSRIIKDEQDLLDVMRGQVVTHVAEEEPKTATTTANELTILETMGLEVEDVDDAEIALIKDKLGEISGKFYKAWRVRNFATQKRFDEFVEKEHITDTRLYWHGSRNENWWSIINNGLMIRPSNAVLTGAMFGYGIYSANKARKSLGYTSLSGSYWAHGGSNFAFMALMEFAYGKPYNIYDHKVKYYDYNYEKLQADCPGANCLHAHAGRSLRNDEIIFYNVEQCTIKYLVELR